MYNIIFTYNLTTLLVEWAKDINYLTVTMIVMYITKTKAKKREQNLQVSI
jgi:hypothetical protein